MSFHLFVVLLFPHASLSLCIDLQNPSYIKATASVPIVPLMSLCPVSLPSDTLPTVRKRILIVHEY